MPKITVLTIAYNAERTLKRAVDSILDQTFKDLEYIIVDHGSTDSTRQMIKDYEREDKRVHGLYLDENGLNKGDFNYTTRMIVGLLKESSARWGVLLDSDDSYELTALEDMLLFAEQNECDIVCCGSNFVDESTGQLNMQRMSKSHAVLRGRDRFNEQFVKYHQFMRMYWAKLISLDIFRSPDFTVDRKNIMCDTGIMISAFEDAEVVGFLSKPLHTWYVSGNSASRRLVTQARVDFNIYCYLRAMEYLRAKCGVVVQKNHAFMMMVFMNELKDSFNTMLTADMPEAEKFTLIRSMVLDDCTKELASYEGFGALYTDEEEALNERKSFFLQIANWLLSFETIPDGRVEEYCEVGELVSAAADFAAGWLTFKKLLVIYLLEQGRNCEAGPKLDELAELLPDDEEIAAMRKAVVIVGLNAYSKKLKQTIENDNHNGVLKYFWDDTNQNIGRLVEKDRIIDITQLKDLYMSDGIDKIIVAYPGFRYPYSEIYETLYCAGILDKVYIVSIDWYYKQDGSLSEALVKADMTRGVLDVMEIDICPHCNLSCKGCAACAPLMKEEYMSVETFKEYLDLLASKFWHISRFRISGGESLLHPDCAEFVRLVRQYYPATEFAVQSNGLLIYTQPSKLERLFKTMNECSCRMYISAYRPTLEKKEIISNHLQKYGVEFFWAGNLEDGAVDNFFCKKILSPRSDMYEEYKLCGVNRICHLISDGYLYPCGNVLNGFMRIQQAFGIKFDGFDDDLDKMRIDIKNTTLNGYELVRALNTATPACRYCSAKEQANFPWKQVPRSEAKLEDFVIEAP